MSAPHARSSTELKPSCWESKTRTHLSSTAVPLPTMLSGTERPISKQQQDLVRHAQYSSHSRCSRLRHWNALSPTKLSSQKILPPKRV